MVKQFFIVGRNPGLSVAEIESYLEARGRKFTRLFFEGNIVVYELDVEININVLGGSVKSGVILSEGNDYTVESYIMSQDLVDSDKFSYAVFGNMEPDTLKAKFRSEKRKVTLRHGRKKIRFQHDRGNASRVTKKKGGFGNDSVSGESSLLPSADHYFFLYSFLDVFYFGIVNQEYDSKAVAFRDMKKPERREELAISPRLAKILINLSGATDKETMLDCFCGVGGIISEALILGINCYGVDIDKMAIYHGRKNLEWLRKQYTITAKGKIETKDARSLREKGIGSIATETPLGIVVRKTPTADAAVKIIRDFERMIVPILANMKRIKKKHARIAITFPRVRGVSVNVEYITERTGLEAVLGPILEVRDKQYISREILVFK
ncbi:MAG: tRNA G10 N-methylase Trm11 [Patescibacteria group bacterium]|jgi:tRNA G10  N-methylase Trm11